MPAQILYSVKAQRGPTLRCKGWKQESLLRMLENNMENAEAPERLVIYGGMGKCARNWESFHAVVEELKNLENDETLVMQSGMPVAIFKTHRLAPRVLMANTNIIKPTWEIFYDLQDRNLTMFSQYTAGPWEYIGTQGVIQGTFETLGAIGNQHFAGSLVGRIYFTAGLGGMGRNQPRAMTMHGGVCVVVDANPAMIERALARHFLDAQAGSLEEAIDMAEEAKAQRRPLGVGVHGNAAEMFPKALETNWKPDIVSEMCPCHDPFSYIPAGYTPQEAAELRATNRPRYLEKARESMKRQLRAMIEFHHQGVQAFEYGTSIRKECRDAGMPREEAMTIPGFVAAYIRPLFLLGRGPFRWTCISGEASDLATLDDLVLEMFPYDKTTARWIQLAREHLPIEALPARVCYLGFGERKAFALKVNGMIREGRLAGPVAFSRDNLDSGSIVNPTFESENMNDGSDLISDWPYLNALLNTAAMADLVAIQANYSMGEAVHTGVTMIADGSEEADLRLEACMTTDSGIGVVRHAQAGYDLARQVAEGKGPLTRERIKVPLWWSPQATFALRKVPRFAQARTHARRSEMWGAVPTRPRADLVIAGAAEVLTCVHEGDDLIGRRPGAQIAIAGERIIALGSPADVARQVDTTAAEVLDVSGKIVAPGFVDCHTHLVFGGSRVQEYAARMTMEASQVQGLGIPSGIQATVAMTRAESVDSLTASAAQRVQRMFRHGTTTLESKSGYGLSLAEEIKQLEVNQRLQASQPVDVVSTFLGAHDFPPELPRHKYVELLTKEMIPKVAELGLAEFCDVYCDQGYYTAQESRSILESGLQAGLKPKIHIDAYADIGGAAVAAELAVVSADHLNYTDRASLRKLAEAGATGVAMPGLDFAVRHPRPVDARAILAEGVTLALATDLCPACWLESMQMVMQLACRQHRLAPTEALYAATSGAARALGLQDDRGSLEPGKLADIQVWDLPTFEDVIYRLGHNAVTTVVKRGKVYHFVGVA